MPDNAMQLAFICEMLEIPTPAWNLSSSMMHFIVGLDYH